MRPFGSFVTGKKGKRRLLLLLETQRRRCFYCVQPLAAEDGVLDHIRPKSKGGKNGIENRVAACVACDRAKAHRVLDDDAVRNQIEFFNGVRPEPETFS